MNPRTTSVAVALRFLSVVTACLGLSISLAWLAYAVLFAPDTELLSPLSAVLSLLFPGVALVVFLVSKPLAQLITLGLNDPA